MRLREMTKRLYAELQEAEKRHQEDRETLQVSDTHTCILFSFHLLLNSGNDLMIFNEL